MTDQFQPLNYSNDLSASSLGSYGTQMPYLAGNVAPVGQAAVTVAKTPGTLFSSLFGDNGAFTMKNMFGGMDSSGAGNMGWAPAALGVGQAIMGGMQGQKSLAMAENQLKEGKRQFNLNYDAQKQTTNTQLEDRQRARVAANSGAYQSVDAYMAKNKVI